jgi:hypothetical protein
MGRQAGCACLLPKDRCSCQRSALPDRRARVGTAPGRQRAAPHHRGAKEHVPEGTGFGIRSRTAIRSRRPETTPRGVVSQARRGNRSAAGRLT